MQILAVSGSLRAVSSNTTFLQAAAALAPGGVSVHLYQGLGALPHFNPDDEDEPNAAVTDWRSHLRTADGLLLSTPEYAHGLPGVLKNALDWVVGSGELMCKPFTLFHASPHSRYAPEQLVEIVKTMDAVFIPEAFLTLPLRGKALDTDGILAEEEFALAIEAALKTFVTAIHKQKHRQKETVAT